ncbi:Hypothetical protein HVPorG_02546 [Roseomonas mucosa]|uniref:class I SAM-dependent methyltransferase n=1 Tax=Roseomonas mucosa TaxID=207340 RepID=UPI0021F93688|nr:class I SAM-dependent methyltransferase [Roseomonas mucosa]QDJ10824.1 Hypothetical protein HVPorG_02546 [Roseomonas mucosa]
MPDSLAVSLPAPIAIMSFNRPGMLERVLVSLKAQTLPVAEERVHLFQDAARNPFGGTSRATEEDIAACVSTFRRHFPHGVVHEAPHNLGIALNFDRAERFFFETLGAELGIFFEDDMVLSPHYLDALERLSAFALAEEKVGYVAAYGQHHATPEKHRRFRHQIVPMGHNWGFALTRRQWKRQQEIVEGYLNFVRNRDYRNRPHNEIREYFARLGMPAAETSQDKAKEVACAIIGTARVMCFPTYGHYIGDIGEHYSPELYRQLEFDRTVLFNEAPVDFLFPDRLKLDEMVQSARATLHRLVGTEPVPNNSLPPVSLPSELFVETLYEGLLGRKPDAAGQQAFTNVLESKVMQPAEVVQSIVASKEFGLRYSRNLTCSGLADTVPYPKPSSLVWELQQKIFGEDIYAGFVPTRRKELQNRNGYHVAFAREIAARTPRVIIDVGAWTGASTIHMAKHMRSLGLQGAVIAVDTFLGGSEHWNRDRSDRIFEELGLRHGWPSLYWQFLSNVVAEGVSNLVLPIPQTSVNAAIILQRIGVRASIIHIDAAREYEAVLRDAKLYWDLLEPGGVLMGDGYLSQDVVHATQEFAAEVGQPLLIEEPKWLIEKPS